MEISGETQIVLLDLSDEPENSWILLGRAKASRMPGACDPSIGAVSNRCTLYR
jgi:hypothetical protein